MERRESKTTNKIIWMCIKRPPPMKCPALLCTDKRIEHCEITKEHNHGPNEERVEVERLKHEMREMARTSLQKPNQIYSFVVARSSNQVKALLPTSRRFARKNWPRDPASLEELIIPESWASTPGENPERFIQYDNGINSSERIIFSADGHLQRLIASSTWCMDGNFHMAPKLFTQLYIIHAKIGECFYPLAFALMEKKTQASYEIMFRELFRFGC